MGEVTNDAAASNKEQDMNAAEVNEYNASQLNDSYRIEDENGLKFFMEHNQTEAKALAQYLMCETGHLYRVVRVPRDVVAAAKKLRPNPSRYPYREEALQDMGVI